jgi:mono/diheme cytochrome c family protein
MKLAALVVVAAVALVLLGGCERTFRDMYDQPRYKPLAASAQWPDGRASRVPVAGTIAHSEGTFAGSTSGRLAPASTAPRVDPLASVRPDLLAASADSGFVMPASTPQLLARGRDRFDIFCAPCHSVAGDGDGMIVRRGFPRPPSFHTDALRAASDAHIYAVITYGHGAMNSYATRNEPADRLAIVAYVRALQLSQHAPLAAVAADARARLEGAPR